MRLYKAATLVLAVGVLAVGCAVQRSLQPGEIHGTYQRDASVVTQHRIGTSPYIVSYSSSDCNASCSREHAGTDAAIAGSLFTLMT